MTTDFSRLRNGNGMQAVKLVCFLARIILTELQSASNGSNRKINNENNEVYYQRNRRFLLTSEL